MKQQTKFKYGLKNASAFLQQFRRQRLCGPNYSVEQINEKQQTFDNCQIPNSKESPKLATKTNQQINPYLKTKKHTSSLVTQNLQQYQLMKNQPEKVGLADLVTKQHLQRTLKTYYQDLKQFEENRDNLLQAIQELTLKIKSLNDMQNKNQILQLQNFKCKKQIVSLVKQYHELKFNLQRKKIKVQQNFQKKKEKIKSLIQVFQTQNQYIVQVQSWNFYLHELKLNKLNNKQSPAEKKVLEDIFPKVDAGQQVTNKKKQKGKATTIDKSGLLGDLKSFAKKFKMPNSSNQV